MRRNESVLDFIINYKTKNVIFLIISKYLYILKYFNFKNPKII